MKLRPICFEAATTSTPNSFCWICHPSVLCIWIVRHHTVEAESLTDCTICVLCVITSWIQNLSPTAQCVHWNLQYIHVFSDFVFKIRLIRLGFSFQKTKNPVLEPPTYWFSGVLIITPNEPTVSGSHRKAFSSLQSCSTDSSWIHLFLLIQLI